MTGQMQSFFENFVIVDYWPIGGRSNPNRSW